MKDTRKGARRAANAPRPPANRPGPATRDPRRRRALVAGAAIAAVAIAVAAVLIVLSQRSADEASGPSASEVAAGEIRGREQVAGLLDGIPQDGDTLGWPEAPVTVVEMGDLRCPACATFERTQWPRVVDELIRTRKARFRFVNWPILGPDSERASAAALAAAQQDRMFQFTTLWYENQQDEGTEYATPAFTDAVATAAGLDLAAFRAARDDPGTWAAQVQEASVIASEFGFVGTPSFWVEGPGSDGPERLPRGVPTAEALVRAVEGAS